MLGSWLRQVRCILGLVCIARRVLQTTVLSAAAVIAAEQGDSGPLQPSHYATAYQQLDQQGKVPRKTPSKKLKL